MSQHVSRIVIMALPNYGLWSARSRIPQLPWMSFSKWVGEPDQQMPSCCSSVQLQDVFVQSQNSFGQI